MRDRSGRLGRRCGGGPCGARQGGAAAAQVENETTAEVLEDVGDDLSDSTDSVLSEYLAIGPVIYVDQGSRITVMVDRDVEIF